MDRVNSIDEARSWFLNNSSGSVLCCSGDETFEATHYYEAVEWFEARNETA